MIIDGAINSACNCIDSSGEYISYIFIVIDDSNQESTSWIIDSRVTYHMCSSKSMFPSLMTFTIPHLIGLPNVNRFMFHIVEVFLFMTPLCWLCSICSRVQAQSHFSCQNYFST